MAAQLASDDLAEEESRLAELRDRLHGVLSGRIPGLQINGHMVRRLPNTLNVSAPGIAGYVWLGMTPGVAASTGSACHSASSEPSPALTAMGLGVERASGAVRLSLGRWTSVDEIDAAADLLVDSYHAAVESGLAIV